MSKQTKFTMESGTVYTLIDEHYFRIKQLSGYEWSIKPWQWFAFDEEDPAVEDGVKGILDNAKRLEPAPGLRIIVWGKEQWRISTRIKTIEKFDE